MPKRARKLEVDEVRYRSERLIEPIAREHDRKRRLGSDHGVPGRDAVQSRQDRVGGGGNHLGQRRIELLAGAAAGELAGRIDPPDPVGHLDEIRQLRDPRRQRHRLSLQVTGPAATVPLLICCSQRLEDVVGKPQLLGQRPRDRRVMSDHAVHLAVARDRELQPDSKPMQRRIARSDSAESGHRRAHAAELVVVLRRLQRDVVPEPLRLLVRVGVAAHVISSAVYYTALRVPSSRPRRSASRSAIRHWRSTCSIGCPKPRSIPSESAPTSSASRTWGAIDIAAHKPHPTAVCGPAPKMGRTAHDLIALRT